MRRSKALHAATLLIDQDRRLATDRSTKVSDQPPQNIGLRDITLEENDAPGIGLSEEPPFRIR